MKGAPTPAWTFIIVPPTPKAATRRVGIRMRTVRRMAYLLLMLMLPVPVLVWSWVVKQASHATLLADQLAAHEQMIVMLADSLDTYRSVALAERAAKLPPPNMIMPLDSRITSSFSNRRLHPILRVNRPHRGVDIAAPAGTRIVAPALATVASVRRTIGYGLVVELVHSGGVVTRYAHCRSVLVKPGDRVQAGQAIATVGWSGLATSSHLHFELLVKGKAVDPVRFVAQTRTDDIRDSVRAVPLDAVTPVPASDE